MKLRMVILLLVVVTVVAVLLFHGQPRTPQTGESQRTIATEPAPQVDAVTPFPADSNLKFSVLRERVLAPYRLRPDRRVLLAVAEIRRLAGLPDSAVTAQFASGRWTLRCGSQEVGKLSELPDFPEMFDLVTEWARAQAWSRGWADNSGPERTDLIQALDRLDAPAALREADRAWAAGSRDAALFRETAHAYAMLALETPDWAGMTDPIVARALGSLAFARALGAEDPKREICLIAEVMGYSAAARAQARRLPAEDPLRLYVTRDDARLENVAAAAIGSQRLLVRPATATTRARATKARSGKAGTVGHATTRVIPPRTSIDAPQAIRLEAPFLHLLRVASRGDYATWSSLLTRFDRSGVPSTLVIGTGIPIQHPDAPVGVAEKLFQAMEQRSTARKLGPRSRGTAATVGNLAQQVQRCEVTLDSQPQPGRGVLFDADFARAQERSLLYAAVDRLGEQNLQTMTATDLSRWFAPAPRKRTARRAAAFQRWYAHLADARVGRGEIATMRADVDSAAPGTAEALRSYQALRPYLSFDDSSMRATVRGLVRRMDSRPEHRAALATIAGHDLVALSLAERLGTSAANELGDSDSGLLIWQERFRGDTDTLRVGSTRKSAKARGAIADLPDSLVGPALARRLAADPTEWELAKRYATWLEEHERYATARRVIERWVAHIGRDSSLDRTSIEAKAQIARLHQLEGHPEAGLRVLGDLHRTGQFAAMERTALILQDLGQPHQSLAIAWAAHRRTPQLAAGRALLAELFWRQGRYGEAAGILHDGRARLTTADWTREIAPRFVAFFRTREREGLEAAEALMRAGFTDRASIGSITAALGAEDLDQFAFEVQSRIQLPGVRQIEASILAYGHLKRARGEAAALTWIRGRVADKDRELLGLLAHQERHPELLWTMSPARLQGMRGDYHWLLRAAACMTLGTSDPHYAETAQRLERARGSYHLEIARYLLGQREQSEILILPQTLEQRAEVCYFIGLKAEQQGRLREAADWYLMSVECGAMDTIESRWAMQQLQSRPSEGRRSERTIPTSTPPA
jgi:hypothetical protein